MNVKQCIKENGWEINCDVAGCRYMIVHVVFEVNGLDDSVSFDIKAYDTNELSELFCGFCKENKFPTNTVTNISIVAAASTKKELLKIDM